MDNKKKYIILVILIIVLFLVGTFICIDLFSKNSSNLLLIGDKKVNTGFIEKSNDIEESSDKVDTDTSSEDVEVLPENSKVIVDIKDIDNNKNSNDSSNIKEYNYSEEDVVSYFENMENEVENSSSFKEKFKEYFITIVDFVFYDREIKGYTFSEISGTAKAKIIGIALKIDSKIEEYLPNYKENISSTSSKIYTNVKEKLVTLYMDVATDICSGDNEIECARVKDMFGEIKNVCKIGWQFIKNLVGNGITKVKEWYEIYSGK